MSGLDWVVLAIIAVSAAIGVFRGVVKEVFSLGAWVAGVVAAWLFGEQAIHLLSGASVARSLTQVVLGYATVFFAAFLAMTLVSYLLRATLNAIGLKPLDRGLGVLFGLVRAGLIVVLVGIVAALSKSTAAPWWKDALSAPFIETAVMAIRPWLPPSIAQRIRFGETTVPTAQIDRLQETLACAQS